MADPTAEAVRAIAQLTTALVEAMTRLSIAMIERRAQRLREAARRSEFAARKERARLERHHAADAAIWQRTTNPAWWGKATPEQIAQAWRAASTWHQVDPDAAATRAVIAERLRRRGVDLNEDRTAEPGDARWLRTALHLARAEREEQVAFAAELDSDAVPTEELLWNADEQPGPRPDAVATEPDRPYAPSEEVRDQMAGLLRQAWSDDASRAERVIADEAWPTLAASMHRLQAAGKNVPALLRRLDPEVTESSIPAVTTAWALRTAAASPVALQRVIDRRQAHHARLTRASEKDQAARLLGVAFPVGTADAINRPRQTTHGQTPASTRELARQAQR